MGQDHPISGEDERPVSFLGRSVPAGMAVRLVLIPEDGELAYEPSEWAGALVIVEVGEVELECHSGACAQFGEGSIVFFEGLSLRAVRNAGRGPALLSAVSRCGQHSLTRAAPRSCLTPHRVTRLYKEGL